MIVVESKRKKIETIQKTYPNAIVVDVTSKSSDMFRKLSPFYPHRGIPIPFSGSCKGVSVEGIWQGLKVFEGEGINMDSFRNDTMQNMKRTVRTHGKCLGHQKGLGSKELLGYIEARKAIYLPCYLWMLKNRCSRQVEQLRKMSNEKVVVLLDYETNGDIEAHKPLSHASLIKAYIDGNYPACERLENEAPAANTSFEIGDKVRHEEYGIGTITNVTNEGDVLTIDFGNLVKKLCPRFAKLERV